ncbi:uncharacterized protein PHALS_02551 [Plasmopara halstedii]|uniref:Uncharacterized protein n=1 Tax=Plasmopara halstedii TaxID=4781 RepID=A0A0P1AX35_PLAHL|nr:uncharacterized protein PHALS_02551 [Plasmopara halstedii]CEG46130.1 hypothetical protein PHALS_02551 [Plasmopara halstedii]|eukprot:XP_024582499.1 hypothetical protein PHALS_02551 [Plasmopara halstedii]
MANSFSGDAKAQTAVDSHLFLMFSAGWAVFSLATKAISFPKMVSLFFEREHRFH